MRDWATRVCGNLGDRRHQTCRRRARMRFSEFLKYLIVLLLLAIVLVAVSR